jgi:hypothetical protein
MNRKYKLRRGVVSKLKFATAMAALTLSTFAFANPAPQAANAAQRYKIELQLYDGNAVIAEPKLIVAAGEPAVFSISGSTRLDYHIEIIASPKGKEKTSVALDAKVSKPGWSNRLTTTILLDAQSTVRIGEDDTSKNTIDGFSMDMKVNAIEE